MSGASDQPTGGNDSTPQITASPNAATNTTPALHKKYSSFEPANRQQSGVYQTIIGILNDDKRGPDVLSDFQDESPPTVLLQQNVSTPKDSSSWSVIQLLRQPAYRSMAALASLSGYYQHYMESILHCWKPRLYLCLHTSDRHFRRREVKEL
jgi:hypothetical protein